MFLNKSDLTIIENEINRVNPSTNPVHFAEIDIDNFIIQLDWGYEKQGVSTRNPEDDSETMHLINFSVNAVNENGKNCPVENAREVYLLLLKYCY